MSERDVPREIHEPFIYMALAAALTAGFGYGALLVGSVALGIVPGLWWGATVQAHGHTQLFGWLGFFVMGMGLYFLPRLRGVTLQKATRIPYVIGLIGGGLFLRVCAQTWLGFHAAGDAGFPVWQGVWALSAAMELVGGVLLLSMMRATLGSVKPLRVGAPAYPIIFFAILGFSSLSIAFLVNAFGVWNAVARGASTLAPSFDNVVVNLMLYGLAVPMAIVFSVRNLPLFMRLASPPRDSLRAMAIIYAVSLFLALVPWLANDVATLFGGLNDTVGRWLNGAQILGIVAVNLCILIFVVQLDIARLRPAWIVNRAPNTRPDLDYLRKPTRKSYPDAGEYGRFELLIYSAYIWLVVSVILTFGNLLGAATGWFSVSADAGRHALTVGFITLLIFGMAVRMGPGFSRKKGVAFPQLVFVTFVLGNLAAILRVVPIFFPGSNLALPLWGLSGFIGWLGVAVLAVNLTATFRRTDPVKNGVRP